MAVHSNACTSVRSVEHLKACDALEREAQILVSWSAKCDGGTPVATCPGWTVETLLGHIGFNHRWAEHMVRVRTTQRISPRTFAPVPSVVTPQWLSEGATSLVATLRAADPNEEMWAWGLDQHVRFWSRRQLHETLMHRLDLALACAKPWTTTTDIATDAVDEFFENFSAAASFSPLMKQLNGVGQSLEMICNDAPERWIVTLTPDGAMIDPMVVDPDVRWRAPASTLLSVLYRRRALDDVDSEVSGEL